MPNTRVSPIAVVPRDSHNRLILLGASLLLAIAPLVHAQCQGTLTSVDAAASCTGRNHAPLSKGSIDANKPYSLEELIDIAEANNPRTRIAWEAAKQAAEQLGMARSQYYPHLAALALAGAQRMIEPWPRALGATNGYFLLDASSLESGVELQYNVYDFGRRGGRVEAGKAARLAAVAVFQRTNQDVAFRVVTSYFNLITAQERLEASRQIVKTSQTTQDVAEAQLANGRATLPDVLNARAAAAQARYDLEASVGAVDTARVALRETVGAEPSDAIVVEPPTNLPLPSQVADSTAELVSRAMQQRPDLRAISEKLRAASAQLKTAKAENFPTIQFGAFTGQQALWPSTNLAGPNQLGYANETVWNVGVSARWTIFDGGLRRHEILEAESRRRAVESEKREKEDAIGREVWVAYVQFRTSVRQHDAAETLLKSATTSYDASLDAYRYGVKNLVDLVTAENQLAQARLAVVQSRSAVRINAANLDYTTGSMLRRQTPVAQPDVKKP